MKKETIICSAVWFKELPLKAGPFLNQNPINVDKGLVFCGHRHAHCIYTMIAITGLRAIPKESGEQIQGFLTSRNRFLDRKQAAELFKSLGGKLNYGSELYSEDLY